MMAVSAGLVGVCVEWVGWCGGVEGGGGRLWSVEERVVVGLP